jgi:hypothetical protein
MMQARWINPIGLTGAVALAALVAAAPAGAQDDSVEPSSIWNLEQRVWGGIVRGLGLKDPNAPAIEYRERSPLVVPPTRDLPPPQAKATPKGGAWPNDPDVSKARKAQEAKKRGIGATNARIENQGRPISPDELNRGTTTTGSVPSNRSNAPAPGSDPDGRPIEPSGLGYIGGLFSGRAWGFGAYQEETGTFTSEPPRTVLTEPPPGYQTPSAAEPYGVTKRIERSKVEQFDPAGREASR